MLLKNDYLPYECCPILETVHTLYPQNVLQSKRDIKNHMLHGFGTT